MGRGRRATVRSADPDHADFIGITAVNDAKGGPDQFAQVWHVEFRDNSSHIRLLAKQLHLFDDLANQFLANAGHLLLAVEFEDSAQIRNSRVGE